jgi:sulfate adenylyltransferase large subunit
MATLTIPTFQIEDFLAKEREKDILRFSTAGSVDDGKSTLIGRLLYDTQSVYEDQVKSIEGKGTTAPGQIDFALLTDGLRAEREQGITIDVAYRYFSTARRKFIIADTPGHEQYTRNMATGASTADAAVVLIDASKGVLVQSRRHAYIASLLRVQHVIVAVNKMDLIDYDQAKFQAIEADFQRLLDQIAADTGNPVQPIFLPVSALVGDNIVHRSSTMPWYDGPSLLELLEELPTSLDTRSEPFRFPVQRVLRPDRTFRGFSGQIASGTIRPGDRVLIQPSGLEAQVARIVTFDGDLDEAHAPLSVTLVLDRELDISRGDLIVASEQPARVVKSLGAALVWMHERPLDRSRRYLLKHTSQTVPASITAIAHRTNIATLSREPAQTLEMNAIGVVDIQLLRPISLDVYSANRSTGAFILIDPETNHTVAAGMVTAAGRTASAFGPVTIEERAIRWGHRGAVLHLEGPATLIDAIERSLFQSGAITLRIDAANPALTALTEAAIDGGMLALVVHENGSNTLTVSILDEQLTLDTEPIDGADHAGVAIEAIRNLLGSTGIVAWSGKGIDL